MNNPAANNLEAQLSKVAADQRIVMNQMKEELKKQNQTHIADMSRLLEGFASLVGRVVKAEVEKAVSDLRIKDVDRDSTSDFADSDSADVGFKTNNAVMSTGERSPMTWSNVHKSPERTIPCEATSRYSNEGKSEQQENDSKRSERGEECHSKISGKSNPKQVGESPSNTSSVKRHGEEKKMDSRNMSVSNGSNKVTATAASGQSSSKGSVSNLNNVSLPVGKHIKDDMSSAVHFFPTDAPASVQIFDISKLAESGLFGKSPVYYMQDCPCKVQLSFSFTDQFVLKVGANIWGLSANKLEPARVFDITGEIRHPGSREYTYLFEGISAPLPVVQSSNGKMVDLNVCLYTSRGTHSPVTLKVLKTKGYIHEKDSIVIKIFIYSKKVKGPGNKVM